METYAFYLFKSSVWLTGFSLIYFLFLRNERFFVLNRIYLITGILASLIFPLITLHYTVELPLVPTTQDFTPRVQHVVPQLPAQPDYSWLWYIYLTGITYLIFRIIKQTLPVLNLIRKSEAQIRHSVKLIRTDRFPASFSFFSFVFVNPSIDDIETNEIVSHEAEHVSQKHWIDLLLYEALCVVQWANPVVWLYGRMIRQNHEYLADERALQRSANPALYRAALLNQMFGGPVIQLANSFNYSLNKKRFNMMKQTISSPLRKFRLLFILPFIAGALYAFATPEYKIIRQNDATTTVPQQAAEKVVKGKVVAEDGTPLKSASVIVAGKTIGTITDANGNFQLRLTDDSPLVISYVGYNSEKVNPDFEKEMLVTLKTKVIGIDAVGNDVSSDNLKKKPLILIDGKESTKAEMDKLKSDEINSVSILKDEKAIAKYGSKGEDGVIEITLKSALDNSNTQSFKLQNHEPLNVISTGGPNDPLVLVDGKIIGDKQLHSLAPQDIASISVLKDASATALYGEKGKNGVVLITMKKGQSSNTEADKIVNSQVKDSPPTFPGGYLEMQKWIASQLKYPETAVEKGIQGRVLVKCWLSKTGNIHDVEISQGVEKSLDDEAIRIVKSMPNWIPARHEGKLIDAQIAIDVNFSLPNTSKSNTSSTNGNGTFYIVEGMPQFPGGVEALKSFVALTLKYPEEALEKGIQGKVFVNFVVGKDGNVTNARIARGVDPLLDKEALRIVNSLPKWKPGQQAGEPVKVSYTLPVDFKLPANPSIKENLNLKSAPANANTEKNFEAQQAQSHRLIIVPNPAKNKVTVTVGGLDSNSKLAVSVLDVSGNVVKKETKNGPTFRLSLSGVTSGTYLVVVNDGKTQYSGQLVVNP